MDIYEEYCVKSTATQKEKVTAIGLILLAFLGFAGAFLWWPLLIAGLVFGAAAIWYWPRLQYEYEYMLYKNELDIDKVIHKSSRKSLVEIDLHNMEFFTNDPSQVQFYLQSGKASYHDYAGDPGQGEDCWILEHGSGQPDLYKITADQQMLADLRKAWPQKAKLQIKK